MSIGHRHIRGALLAIAGSMALGVVAAAPGYAAAGNGSTNPASGAVAPLSKKELSKAVGESLRKQGLAPAGSSVGAGATRTSGTAAPSSRTGSKTTTPGAGSGRATVPGSAAAGAATPGGTAAGGGTPTVTHVPPAAKPTTGLGAQGKTAPATSSGRAHAKSSTSTAAIVLAGLAALLALASLAWAIARWLAYEPHWTRSMRHAMGEAGFRASATWAEFSDWVRLGR